MRGGEVQYTRVDESSVWDIEAMHELVKITKAEQNKWLFYEWTPKGDNILDKYGYLGMSRQEREYHYQEERRQRAERNSLMQYGLQNARNVWKVATNEEEPEMNVVTKIKNLGLKKGDRLLRKYNLVDETGDITGDGKDVLWQLLLEAYHDQLVEKVTELDDEEKAKAKKK